MYYAYIGKNACVLNSWEEVSIRKLQYPYSKYRKFRTEREAWAYIEKNRFFYKGNRILHTGFNDKDFSVIAKYYIYKGNLYINYILPETIDGSISNIFENVTVTKTLENVVMVEVDGLELNFNSAKSHAKAVCKIIQLLGRIVDIDIYVYDNSIYYASYYYKGNCREYLDLQLALKSRVGKVGYTYEQYGYTEISKEALENQRLYERRYWGKDSI